MRDNGKTSKMCENSRCVKPGEKLPIGPGEFGLYSNSTPLNHPNGYLGVVGRILRSPSELCAEASSRGETVVLGVQARTQTLLSCITGRSNSADNQKFSSSPQRADKHIAKGHLEIVHSLRIHQRLRVSGQLEVVTGPQSILNEASPGNE